MLQVSPVVIVPQEKYKERHAGQIPEAFPVAGLSTKLDEPWAGTSLWMEVVPGYAGRSESQLGFTRDQQAQTRQHISSAVEQAWV